MKATRKDDYKLPLTERKGVKRPRPGDTVEQHQNIDLFG